MDRRARRSRCGASAARAIWPSFRLIRLPMRRSFRWSSRRATSAATLKRACDPSLDASYPALDVVVVDDRSSDGTGDVVRALSREDARVRLIENPELPDGWFGKPWACTTGRQRGARVRSSASRTRTPCHGTSARRARRSGNAGEPAGHALRRRTPGARQLLGAHRPAARVLDARQLATVAPRRSTDRARSRTRSRTVSAYSLGATRTKPSADTVPYGSTWPRTSRWHSICSRPESARR